MAGLPIKCKTEANKYLQTSFDHILWLLRSDWDFFDLPVFCSLNFRWQLSTSSEWKIDVRYNPGQTISTFQRNTSQHCWCNMLLRLATLLRRVATCWVLLAQIWKWPNFSCNLFECCNICCTRACALVRFSNHTYINKVKRTVVKTWIDSRKRTFTRTSQVRTLS